MTSSGRKVLSLNGLAEARDFSSPPIVVGLQDVLLPSRQFAVTHKVAVLGEVSLTTEFLLRLLYSVDDMDEADVAAFFAFDDREMAFVVNEAESRAYIERCGGRVSLTEAGYSLFKMGDKPTIFEVHAATDTVGFDLIALAPCDRERLTPFEAALPELELSDPTAVSTASRLVPDAFRRNFTEIVGRRDGGAVAVPKRALYSVDDVVAGNRFSSIITVALTASALKPSEPEPNLDTWRTGHQLMARAAVVNAIAGFVDNLKSVRSEADEAAYSILVELASDYLEEYRTRDGLSTARYLRAIAGRAGELRADRKTVGVIGPIYTPENLARLQRALELSNVPDEERVRPIWITPVSSTWGASRALINCLDEVTTGGARDDSLQPVAICAGRPSWHLRKAFEIVLQRSDSALPGSIEILLFPRRAVVALAHAPVNTNRGYPVPLGIISFDPEVVRRSHRFIEAQLPRRLNVFGSSGLYDISNAISWS